MLKLPQIIRHIQSPAASTLWGSLRSSKPLRVPATVLLRAMAHLQEAVVRSLPGEPNLTITLTVGGRQRNLDRPKDELLGKPLARLQKSATQPGDRKQKRAKAGQAAVDAAPLQPPTAAPFVGLHEGPSPDTPLIDADSTTNEAAWRQGRLLRVGAASYCVCFNPPTLDRVELHGTPFLGIPVVPALQLHFAADEDCTWEWSRRPYNQPSAQWERIPGASQRGYTPEAEDAGCMLRVTCTPTRPASIQEQQGAVGQPLAAECGPVAVPPAPAAGAGRHELTGDFTRPPHLRVMTYNILADQYAATDTAKDVLFAQCPPECLDPAYRRPLVLGELLGYRPDIAALQEVDERMFSLCLGPAMGEAGYAGTFTNKAGKVREGSAAFWRRERYQLALQRDVVLKELFPAEAGALAKYASAFEPMLQSSPALRAALQRVATVAQVLLLVPPGAEDDLTQDSALQPLCLVNTHLFFHADAPHIRTMHVWAILQEAAEVVRAAQEEEGLRRRCGGRRPAVVFCGDLNSDLNDGIPGAIELLSAGQVPADHWDWFFGVDFKWEKEEAADEAETAPAAGPSASPSSMEQGGGEGEGEGGELSKMVHTEVEGRHPHSPRSPAEIVPGVALASPFALRSADGLRSEFTNYVKGYQGLLDYVWYEPGAMEVRQVVPLPTLKQLGGYLPSPRFPSDHLAVVCELLVKADCGDASPAAAAGAVPAAATGGNSGGTNGGDVGGNRGGTNGGDVGGNRGGSGSDESTGGDGDSGSTERVLPAAQYNVGAAVGALRAGGVIAVPTDTLYGLAACAGQEAAVQRIYAAKGRANGKPVAVCVADPDDVARYVHVEHLPPGLLEALLPGPVTLLLRRRSDAPLAPGLNAGVGTLGVRIPRNQFLRAVCRQHRGALALTSANVSGGPSSVAVGEFQSLWPACEAVLDGGQLQAGREGSTIVDLTQPGRFAFVREGSAREATAAVLQESFGLELSGDGAAE